MPTLVGYELAAKQELAQFMEEARETGQPVHDNKLNRVSKRYGLSLDQIYKIMYEIAKLIQDPRGRLCRATTLW